MQINTTGLTLARAAADLANGRYTARALVEACLERIQDPGGEGKRTFIKVYGDQARSSADAMDLLRRVGRTPGPYAGVPVSLKDLLDVRRPRLMPRSCSGCWPQASCRWAGPT